MELHEIKTIDPKTVNRIEKAHGHRKRMETTRIHLNDGTVHWVDDEAVFVAEVLNLPFPFPVKQNES